MKINDKVLNIPPYLSTTWDQIAAIHMKGSVLAVTLKDGDTVNIPGLKQEAIDSVFHHHADALENSTPIAHEILLNETIERQSMTSSSPPPFQLAFSSLDGLNTMMQHNPEQANAPELPTELLQKITSITKILSTDVSMVLPKPEPHCNCFHCQIARALTPEEEHNLLTESFLETKDDVPVSDEELRFQQWTILQTNDKLFIVTNKLDENEHYNVYLGEPVGCTCGMQGCEHILAVLKS